MRDYLDFAIIGTDLTHETRNCTLQTRMVLDLGGKCKVWEWLLSDMAINVNEMLKWVGEGKVLLRFNPRVILLVDKVCCWWKSVEYLVWERKMFLMWLVLHCCVLIMVAK